jgi:hypothetical protein
MASIIVTVEVGNTDNKLTQAAWSNFWSMVNVAICCTNPEIYGTRESCSISPYQNACWHFSIDTDKVEGLKAALVNLARDFGQDSIAWSEIRHTMFLGTV